MLQAYFYIYVHCAPRNDQENIKPNASKTKREKKSFWEFNQQNCDENTGIFPTKLQWWTSLSTFRINIKSATGDKYRATYVNYNNVEDSAEIIAQNWHATQNEPLRKVGLVISAHFMSSICCFENFAVSCANAFVYCVICRSFMWNFLHISCLYGIVLLAVNFVQYRKKMEKAWMVIDW